MFDILNYNEIVYHIKNYSRIFKLNSNQDWIQIFCPYCDDATRKSGSISHGHFYLSRNFNFAQCFRCDTKTSIKKFLIDIHFENKQFLNTIFKNNLNINYSSEIKRGYYDNTNIIQKHELFRKNNINDYHKFINYINLRIGNVDFEQFFLYPVYINNKLCVSFNNILNEVSTTRFIDNNNIKYYKLQTNVNYFFQELNNINEIVICEGAFDLINIYKYSPLFDINKTFYIALNGRNYISNISNILINNFMIGKYNINVIFDKDVKNIENIKKQIQLKTNTLNPEITTNFYIPTISKDISEFHQLQSIK